MSAPAKYPELPEPVDELAMEDGFNVIGTQPVFTADQMRAYADATEALRHPSDRAVYEQIAGRYTDAARAQDRARAAAPICATCNDNGIIGGPSFQDPGEGGVPCPDCEDLILIPRGLIGAACSVIDKKRDAPKVLAELRRHTIGDLSAAAPQAAVGVSGEQVQAFKTAFHSARELAETCSDYDACVASGIRAVLALSPATKPEAPALFRALLIAERDATIDVSGDIARQEAQIDLADHLLVKFNELFPEAPNVCT